MRSLSLAVVLAALVGGACVPTPPITVVHVGKSAVKDEVVGDPVKMRRPAADTYAGIRGGAYVVRSGEDWQGMWRHAPEQPAFPSTIDPTNEMLVLVATEDAIVSQLTIKHAVETAEAMTVFVRQTMLGEGCVRKSDERAGLDAVVTRRVDKPVKFYIEDEDGPSCGEPPKAEIGCRLATAQTWNAKLTAKTGDVIECELSSVATGKYELVDQTLSLVDAPPGSNAKLAFSKGPTRATLALDAFGTYAVRAEATDEAGRRGRATAFIEVLPKKTRDVLLQLTWSDVDMSEVITPLPRVLLRVTQEGPRGQRCSAEVPVPGLCDAKTRGSYTYMKIPASRRKLPVSLLYLDERAQEGPAPCINVWFNGERTLAVCDRDHRHAEDRWEIGTLETWTGKLAAPKPPPKAKPATGAKPGAPAAAPPGAKSAPATPAPAAPPSKPAPATPAPPASAASKK
ncbi:MAG: hypothetical protein KF782_05015 [Labilithrix sp.]|nr:hypothetical protein [Labilithrix sp.]